MHLYENASKLEVCAEILTKMDLFAKTKALSTVKLEYSELTKFFDLPEEKCEILYSAQGAASCTRFYFSRLRIKCYFQKTNSYVYVQKHIFILNFLSSIFFTKILF